MSISTDNLHARENLFTTETISSLRKQEKQVKNQQIIVTNNYSRQTAHPWSFNSTRPGGSLHREKVLDKFFAASSSGEWWLFQLQPWFWVRPCHHRQCQRSCAAGRPRPGRVAGGTFGHPTGSPGGAHPRTCCQALAAILARWSWRPLASANFELPHLWCNVNRRTL